MLQSLRLCADVSGYFLFDSRGAPLDIASLNLSPNLISSLNTWEACFLKYHLSNLINWWSEDAPITLREFSEMGEDLRRQVQRELGNDFHVHYTNDYELQEKFRQSYQQSREESSERKSA